MYLKEKIFRVIDIIGSFIFLFSILFVYFCFVLIVIHLDIFNWMVYSGIIAIIESFIVVFCYTFSKAKVIFLESLKKFGLLIWGAYLFWISRRIVNYVSFEFFNYHLSKAVSNPIVCLIILLLSFGLWFLLFLKEIKGRSENKRLFYCSILVLVLTVLEFAFFMMAI